MGFKNSSLSWARSLASVWILLVSHSLFGQNPHIRNREIVIVSTTDFHGNLEQAEGLANAIENLRARYGEKMIYVDAGDMFQGTLEGNLSKGKSVVDLMNALQLQVAAIGNHEIDFGPNILGRVIPEKGDEPLGSLLARSKEAKFKWLSLNWVWKQKPRAGFDKFKNASGEFTVFPSSTVIEQAENKVCFLGMTTTQTNSRSFPSLLKGTQFAEYTQRVLLEAQVLRKNSQCHFVVLIAHAGISEKTEDSEINRLLQSLPRKTLDAVIAGHTHYASQRVIHGTPVIQSGALGNVVGALHLYSDGQVAAFDPFIKVKSEAANAAITKLLKPYRDEIQTIQIQTLGNSSQDFLQNYYKENALTNFVADSVMWMAKKYSTVDFAIIQAGNIRANIEKGKITYRDIYKVLPFENNLVIANLTGAELKKVLSIAIEGKFGRAGFSGGFILIDSSDRENEDNKLVNILDKNKKPISDKKIYKVALNDYLTEGGDGQEGVFRSVSKTKLRIIAGISTREAAVRFIRDSKFIDPKAFFNAAQPRFIETPSLKIASGQTPPQSPGQKDF
ncbi:MAG: bifunctional metallophosphatase/5'-nucleotidase [Deltaproteobacteria bacterium]|nr:bifunctional metallophosphatase/5'-nucleotidase [Deltaproteobacteria bacterium]